MTKDVDHHQQPHGNDNNKSGNNHGVIVTDGANASGPLQPVLKFDVSSVDDTISSALIDPDTRSRETLFTLYCLLYDRVSNVQSDERKQTLVYAELCKRLKQLGFVEILPQIDTLRTFHQNYKSHLENLISEISSDIDKKFTSLDIEIADLFCRNSSLPSTKSSKSNFVRLNVLQHRLLNHHPPNAGGYHTSRAKDFINCGLIAKGGFGSVYRMQNVTDKCDYAIKAIPFKSRNQVDASKIMNEVYFAAALPSHQNIVCYKSSWLDHYVKVYGTENDTMVNEENFGSTEFLSSSSSGSSPPKKDSTVGPIIEEPNEYQSVNSEISNQKLPSHKSSQLSSESSSSLSQPHSIHESQKSTSSSSDGLTIEFIDNNESSSQQDQQDDLKPDSKPIQVCLGGDQLVLTTKNNKPPLYYCVLCIQMELCSYNLRAWIDQRNEDIYHKKVDSIDYDKAIDIFIQIVKGVHHLHTHNLIHRDIKPHNILFSESGVVKIGDFGLTTFNANVEVQEDETLAWSGEAQNLTQGLGTSSYSAPEQQNTTSYNYKADIYSLGLIAFELLYPLFTDMERSDRFDKLKNEKLLPEELTKYQPFADLILETVQNDPSARPDTKTILEKESLLRHGWKINSDKQSYEDLIQINRHLNEKILKLEETIRLKDAEITRLKELKEQKD